MDAQTENTSEQEAVSPETTTASTDKRPRLLVAVGDLHCDYFRLVRHLREANLLLPDTFAWNPDANTVDLVLIGDYIDWRGEPLEESPDQSPIDPLSGGRRIIELIAMIKDELELLRSADPSFDSHIYPLLGNHDAMMMEGLGIFKFLNTSQLQELLSKSRNFASLRQKIIDLGITSSQMQVFDRFLNWYVQGGDGTIRGFGGIEKWHKMMQDGCLKFLDDNLYLSVIINDKIFAHTLPDSPTFWRPINELAVLPEDEYQQCREAFMWNRKVWGYEYASGMRTNPFTPDELNKMLTGFGCDSAVIGHTPLSRGTEHVAGYGGRVLNIDVHGAPGAKALIETYVPGEKRNVTPLRSELLHKEA